MFPIKCLFGKPQKEGSVKNNKTTTYTWECTIVPEITLVWEAVANKAKLALLDVLLDGVEEFLLANLQSHCLISTRHEATQVEHQS